MHNIHSNGRKKSRKRIKREKKGTIKGVNKTYKVHDRLVNYSAFKSA